MAQVEIVRFSDAVKTVVAHVTAGTTSGRIPMLLFGGAAVIVSHTGGATEIQWHGAASPEATPVQIYSDGSAVTTAMTVGIHPVPDAAFAVPYVTPILSNGTTSQMTVMAKG
jgi:hypothetical protein